MIALLAAAVLTLASETSAGQPKPPLAHATVPARGDAIKVGGDLYALHCLACHGDKLQGTPQAPGLMNSGAASVDFQLSTGRMPLEVPGTEPMRGPPSFPRDQIDAIIAYVVSHGAKGPDKPAVHSNGDLTRGRKLYEENCEACHGATATGAVAGFGWLAPALLQSTPLQTAEAVRTGPGIMPKFDERVLPQADLDALAAYVDSLHHPDDRGGYSLASAGPVGEGLVAWIAGLGITVVLMFAVGETLKAKPRG
ncbi:MAG: menaquinol-cytochrome c reductase cytochrome c1 subunit precursor [Candidatus Eremiobacteraeota bacterium]|nr:menaquinol-cytochrome c reductase cytochrome c1 subunit precursor [Candidatus Eremiobacteraeota bacterium]